MDNEINVYSVPVAIEHNADGSVTLCREVVEEILADKELPTWIAGLLKPAEFGTLERYGKIQEFDLSLSPGRAFTVDRTE